MKRIASIIDTIGSFFIHYNGSTIYPMLSFNSKKHDDIKYMSTKLQVPLRQYLIYGKPTSCLTIYTNKLVYVLPKIIPLMKNKYRVEIAEIIFKCCAVSSNRRMSFEEKKGIFIDYKKKLAAVKLRKTLGE